MGKPLILSLRQRSTERLKRDLESARKWECECDGYYNYECGKHHRIVCLEEILAGRTALTRSNKDDRHGEV